MPIFQNGYQGSEIGEYIVFEWGVGYKTENHQSCVEQLSKVETTICTINQHADNYREIPCFLMEDKGCW